MGIFSLSRQDGRKKDRSKEGRGERWKDSRYEGRKEKRKRRTALVTLCELISCLISNITHPSDKWDVNICVV